MDNKQTIPAFFSAEETAHAGGRLVFTDPWAEVGTGWERRDSWMLSYIDILTLLLTLFVLLLMLQPKYESPVSAEIPEISKPMSNMPIGRQSTAVLLDYETEAEESIALTETTDDGLDLAPATEFGLDAAVAGIEPGMSIEAIGTSTFFALESLIRPHQSIESLVEDIIVEPVPWAAEMPAMMAALPAIDPPANHAQRPRSNTSDAVLEELSEHKLDSRLKVSQVAEGVHLEVSDKILFTAGSAELKPEGQALLDELAQILLQHRGTISVEGHTDNQPISSERFPSNWELSSGRATTVTRHLIEHGLDSAKLRAVGYADTRPLETNTTEEGRTRNRRVSLILTPAQAQ